TQRFVDEFDWFNTYMNLFTATEPGVMNTREGQLPLALPSDREAITAGLFSSLASDHPRVCRIKSTAELDEMWASEALLGDARGDERLSIEGSPEQLAFDQKGDLF
ncbi:MAG TPA: hypothetical protein VLI65_10225, partial [Pyrinomonadaceae bacterium]|nr:hypothetical protein [Pyrinomonadaceae bacterium]